MTSLTALMRVDAGAGVPSAPVAAGERFAALLTGEAPSVVAQPEPGIPTITKLTPDPAAAPVDALRIDAPVIAERPPSATPALPVERQPAATTGKALPVTQDGPTPTLPEKARHPGPVPGSTVPQSIVREARAKAPAAPWTLEQVRCDDAGYASDIGELVTVVAPVDTGSPAYVVAIPTPLPAVVPVPAMPIVEAPAARSQDVAIAALTPVQPAAVSFSTPPPADVPVGAPALTPTATAPDRTLPPAALPNDAARQIEAPRPTPAPIIARPGTDAAPTIITEPTTAPIESPRVTASHRSPQPEAPTRPSSREPLPQPVPPTITVTPPGTDRLLRARPNTAYAHEEIAVTIGPVAAPAITDTPAVRDPAPAQIDTQSSDWMHSMIERIETLTGEHGQRETKLKLSPDALGEVELRLRESPDGTLMLDMDAVTPEARALLAEAAPRLVEMGEARGLRLSMQAGGGSGEGQPQHNRESHRPGTDAPLPNRRPATQQGNPDDERIA